MRPDLNDTNAATEAPRTNLVALYFEASRALNVLRTSIHRLTLEELKAQLDARGASKRLVELAERINTEVVKVTDLTRDELSAEKARRAGWKKGLGLLLALAALAAPGQAQLVDMAEAVPSWLVAVVAEAHRVAGDGSPFDPGLVNLGGSDRLDLSVLSQADQARLIGSCETSRRFSQAVLEAHYEAES